MLEAENPNQLCTVILNEISQITEIKSGIICLFDNEKLKNVYSIGIQGKVVCTTKNQIYKVYNNKKILLSEKNEIKHYKFLKNFKSCYALYLPMIHHRDSIGIIVLFSEKPITFNKKYLSLLQLFTSMSAVSIKKTQLHLQVQNALEMRDRFIALASHELRTPLTSLSGYVQLLYKKLANKNTIESRWVEELYQECARLTYLIKELLDINRIKQGQLEFILNEVDVAEIVKKAIERFRFINFEKEIIFSNKLINGSGRIIGDYEKLLQMLNALLTNAAKFSPPASKIRIEIECDLRFIYLKVIDQGSGIPDKDLKKIFEGFYKIGKNEKEGLGVGLMLTEHIVKKHRGKMHIVSGENTGTQIEVSFPRLK